MKPRNKFQKQVAAAMKGLRPINKDQKGYGRESAVYHYAYRVKSGRTTCLDCGHVFHTEDGQTQCVCPNCGEYLRVENTLKRKHKEKGFFCIGTTKNDMQVMRIIMVSAYYEKGKPARFFFDEIVQQWLNDKGNCVYAARRRNGMCYSNTECWTLNSPLEIRTDSWIYEHVADCPYYPKSTVIPALMRNGYADNEHEVVPSLLFKALLKSPKIETLLKARQYEVARLFIHSSHNNVDSYWPSLKIALRNHYHINDANMWRDYIDLLRYYKKDLSNPKFVCPNDLKAEHDRLYDKKEKQRKEEYERLQRQYEAQRRERELQRLEWEQKTAAEREEVFRNLKSKFFGITFTDGLIKVHVLDSIEAYRQEGETMNHCVYENKYYLKKDSLILSATIDGESIETVEVSLSTLQILQCYGYDNQFTEYHERIIELVNRNTYLIGQRKAA